MINMPNELSVKSELIALSSFLLTYQELEKKLFHPHSSTDISGFKSLFNDFNLFEAKVAILYAKTAPDYNIFSVLNVHIRETKLHTPFLKNLLSPNQSHGQGELFINSFLRKFIQLNVSDLKHVIVYEELNTQYGRIDLFIKYKINNQNKALIIENKVYANDQKKQLERYYEYASSIGYKADDFNIIYLTPYKSEPSEHSISKDKVIALKKINILINLGYQADIAPWLSELINEIQPIQVKSTIQQYINTINSF